MCHAPIVIPALGEDRAGACVRTTRAMAVAAARVTAHAPDVLVLISPHTPRRREGFGIATDAQLSGDFSRFGRSDLCVRAAGAPEAAQALRRSAHARGLKTFAARGADLDHGALVPLYFMIEAGYRGPVLLLSLPAPDSGTEPAIGRAIADAAAQLGQRWAVLASGDMSHRLREGAPAGYDPRAQRFDAAVRTLIESGALVQLAAIDPELRDLAAEDVVDSCVVAAAAVEFDATGCRLIDYEGPFGVGYLEAILHEREPPGVDRAAGIPADDPAAAPPAALLGIARAAIASHLHALPYQPRTLSPPWDEARGAFVTLRTREGVLRGCVGHIEPGFETLSDEIASCAVAAATRDSRFAPVARGELDDLRIELSLLSSPEPIADPAALDPARYGVVVASGARRGVLLPAIEGIASASEQLRIARAKAGIPLGEPASLARFEVLKLLEPTNIGGAHGGH
jgi:AmmeMemoRadiSam system protein A